MPDDRDRSLRASRHDCGSRRRRAAHLELCTPGRIGPAGDLVQQLRGLPGSREAARENDVDARDEPAQPPCRLAEAADAVGRQRPLCVVRPDGRIGVPGRGVPDDVEVVRQSSVFFFAGFALPSPPLPSCFAKYWSALLVFVACSALRSTPRAVRKALVSAATWNASDGTAFVESSRMREPSG